LPADKGDSRAAEPTSVAAETFWGWPAAASERRQSVAGASGRVAAALFARGSCCRCRPNPVGVAADRFVVPELKDVPAVRAVVRGADRTSRCCRGLRSSILHQFVGRGVAGWPYGTAAGSRPNAGRL